LHLSALRRIRKADRTVIGGHCLRSRRRVYGAGGNRINETNLVAVSRNRAVPQAEIGNLCLPYLNGCPEVLRVSRDSKAGVFDGQPEDLQGHLPPPAGFGEGENLLVGLDRTDEDCNGASGDNAVEKKDAEQFNESKCRTGFFTFDWQSGSSSLVIGLRQCQGNTFKVNNIKSRTIKKGRKSFNPKFESEKV
jgi:hypothetical protein